MKASASKKERLLRFLESDEDANFVKSRLVLLRDYFFIAILIIFILFAFLLGFVFFMTHASDLANIMNNITKTIEPYFDAALIILSAPCVVLSWLLCTKDNDVIRGVYFLLLAIFFVLLSSL